MKRPTPCRLNQIAAALFFLSAIVGYVRDDIASGSLYLVIGALFLILSQDDSQPEQIRDMRMTRPNKLLQQTVLCGAAEQRGRQANMVKAMGESSQSEAAIDHKVRSGAFFVDLAIYLPVAFLIREVYFEGLGFRPMVFSGPTQDQLLPRGE